MTAHRRQSDPAMKRPLLLTPRAIGSCVAGGFQRIHGSSTTQQRVFSHCHSLPRSHRVAVAYPNLTYAANKPRITVTQALSRAILPTCPNRLFKTNCIPTQHRVSTMRPGRRFPVVISAVSAVLYVAPTCTRVCAAIKEAVTG